MFFGVFGDTVCHAAQAFLPPKIGNPRAAWAFAKAIFACGAIIGTFNVFASSAFAFYTVPLFTGSAAVQAAVRAALPLFAVHILLHCCSMGTEGVLLAARDGWFLLGTYLLSFAVIQVRRSDCNIHSNSSRQCMAEHTARSCNRSAAHTTLLMQTFVLCLLSPSRVTPGEDVCVVLPSFTCPRVSRCFMRTRPAIGSCIFTVCWAL